MVEHTLQLNSIFGALSDATRRDILKRVGTEELSVSEIAKDYKLTFAAVSKHLKVLERAKLIFKHRQGKQQIVQVSPIAIKDAAECLRSYEAMWNNRFDSLENYLSNLQK